MTTSLQVLVVEDDAVDRAAIRRALSRHGASIEIVETVDIASAVAAREARAFDCTIVDYHLPDGTALDFIREVSVSSRGALPIVILTGMDDDAMAIAALQQGAQDYLAKHEMDGRVLVRTIRYAIERAKGAELQRRLLHADRLVSIGQIAASVAHEVNNPASVVLGNLELLRGYVQELRAKIGERRVAPEIAPKLDECATAIQAGLAGIDRVRSVTRGLLNFAGIEHDEIEMLDLLDLLESTCDLVYNELRHRAQLVRDFQPLPHIAGNRGKLAQVLTNLVMNAIHAIEPGASGNNRIRLASRVEDGRITLTIEDTGVGILPEPRAGVHQPFFAGLGLSLCQDIVRQHGGDITLRSEVSVGTRVDVVLPVDTGLTVATSVRAESPATKLERRARVLIVDDEPAIQRTYTRLLAPYFDVVIADDGREGLAILDHDPHFDVILCDLMMPDVDGIAIYEHLRHERPALSERLVFWTGGAFTQRTRAFLSRVNAVCLNKPISRRQLVDVINRFVDTG